MTFIYMTDIDSWPPKIAAAIYGVTFFSMIISCTSKFYIAKRYLPEITRLLGRSPDAIFWINRFNSGLVNRIFLMSHLTSFVVFPKRHIRNGEASEQDIKEFPDKLKK